jgi:hypothetical protein
LGWLGSRETEAAVGAGPNGSGKLDEGGRDAPMMLGFDAENEPSVNQQATRSTRTAHFDLAAELFVGRSCARVSVSRDFGGAVLLVARRVSPR